MAGNWREYIDSKTPGFLKRLWGERFVDTYRIVLEVMSAALGEALTASWLAEPTSPDDALPRVGFDSNMDRYPVDTNATLRSRLLKRWPTWQDGGSNASILQQLEAAGFPNAEIRERKDWPLRDPAGYWSVFWVLIPYGSHSVKPPREWGDGITWDNFYWGVGDAESALQVQTVRKIVEKWRDAGIICHQVIFQGTAPLWGEFEWGDGTTWGGTPPVIIRMTPKDFS